MCCATKSDAARSPSHNTWWSTYIMALDMRPAEALGLNAPCTSARNQDAKGCVSGVNKTVDWHLLCVVVCMYGEGREWEAWLCLLASRVSGRWARSGVLAKVTGTYSKDQGGISTNACSRLYLPSRGWTPGCRGGGPFLYIHCVCVRALIQHTVSTQRSSRNTFLARPLLYSGVALKCSDCSKKK